jgi:hypothetical protein
VLIEMVPLALAKAPAAKAVSRASVQQITLCGCGASSGAIAGRKQGETKTMFTRTRKDLRLVDEMNLGADRTIATGIVPQRISGPGADRMLVRRIVAKDPEEMRFEALVATIQQRDAADRRATLWERAFFLMAWIAGAAGVAIVLAWMKGRL